MKAAHAGLGGAPRRKFGYVGRKGRGGLAEGKPQISPLRCAPVEMTNLLYVDV